MPYSKKQLSLKVTWNKYKESPDETLVSQFRDSGDLEILGILYERYMHLVYGVSLKYFEDREKAKDSIGAIFEKLITDLPKHEVENFKSWLYVLVKNYCLMALRSEKSKTRKRSGWEKEQDLFMESGYELHPIDEEEQNLNQLLMDCIEKLKGEQQECIRRFYFEEKSYRQISKELKLEEKKVKSYIQNGKRNLKICMEKDHGEEAKIS